MLLDFEVQRCTRRCAATERTLEPGDDCYSVLETHGADVVRKDFCSDAWRGMPESAFAWWRSRIPEPTAKKIKLAPNDVLIELFDELADRQDQHDLRYVLTLLLVRRRVLRLDIPAEQVGPLRTESQRTDESMIVYCPKRDTTYHVLVAMPDSARIDEIQQQLSELLIADAH
jgi:hypothetical protein